MLVIEYALDHVQRAVGDRNAVASSAERVQHPHFRVHYRAIHKPAGSPRCAAVAACRASSPTCRKKAAGAARALCRGCRWRRTGGAADAAASGAALRRSAASIAARVSSRASWHARLRLSSLAGRRACEVLRATRRARAGAPRGIPLARPSARTRSGCGCVPARCAACFLLPRGGRRE